MENFSAKKQAKMYFLTMIALDAFKEGIGSYGFDSLEVSKNHNWKLSCCAGP